MARIHFWQYIVNENGDPLENVNVRIYLSNSPEEEADIFTHHITGNPIKSTEALLSTDGNGFFECWFGDILEDSGGYSSNQTFKIEWERAGLLNGYIDNMTIYPNVFSVVQTDNVSPDKDVKNKLISNQLAYNWDTHINAESINVHGLEAVNQYDTNTDYNKLVSNNLMNYVFSVLASAGSISIAASAATAREFDVTSWSSSGGKHYIDLDHFLNRDYPVVTSYKTSNGMQIYPDEIESISSSRIRLWMPDEVSLNITIIG